MNAPVELVSPATVDMRRGVSMTEYRIRGDFDAVMLLAKSLFEQYDGRAYDTRIHSMAVEIDGSFVARMSRANSAD
jgi:hypothetical protein